MYLLLLRCCGVTFTALPASVRFSEGCGDNFINCVQAGRMGEWKRGKDAGRRGLVRREPVAVAILYVARVVTVLMIIGGLSLVV